MNKIFKTKYDAKTGQYKAVSELAKNCQSSSSSDKKPKCGGVLGNFLGMFKIAPLALVMSGLLSGVAYGAELLIHNNQTADTMEEPVKYEKGGKQETLNEGTAVWYSNADLDNANKKRTMKNESIILSSSVNRTGVYANYTNKDFAHTVVVGSRAVAGGNNATVIGYKAIAGENTATPNNRVVKVSEDQAKKIMMMGDTYKAERDQFFNLENDAKWYFSKKQKQRAILQEIAKKEEEKLKAQQKDAKDVLKQEGTAVGYRSFARGQESTSLGNDTVAWGDSSIAIGSDNIANESAKPLSKDMFKLFYNVRDDFNYTEEYATVAFDHIKDAKGEKYLNDKGELKANDGQVISQKGEYYIRKKPENYSNDFGFGDGYYILKTDGKFYEVSEDQKFLNEVKSESTISEIKQLSDYKRYEGYEQELNKLYKQYLSDPRNTKTHTWARGHNAIAIGARSIAYGDNSTALGAFAVAAKDYSTAIGSNTVAFGTGSLAMGNQAYVYANDSLGVGNNVQAINDGSMVYGRHAFAGGKGSLAIGDHTFANITMEDKFNNFAQGMSIEEYNKLAETKKMPTYNSGSTQNAKITIEDLYRHGDTAAIQDLVPHFIVAKVIRQDGTGEQKAEQSKDKQGLHNQGGIAIGSYTVALGDNTLALGRFAYAKEDSAVALGRFAFARDKNSFAAGPFSRVMGESSVALGYNSVVEAEDSVAIGIGAKVNNNNNKASMAIGNYSEADFENSIALGYRAKTDYTAEDLKLDAWAPKNALAIPSSEKIGYLSVGGKNQERRIVNVAPGALDTDAVNVSQLKALEETILYGNIDNSTVNIQSGHYVSIKGSSDFDNLVTKEQDYQRYVKLKADYLKLLARKDINGETFKQEALDKMKERLDKVEAKYTDFKTHAGELTKISPDTFQGKFNEQDSQYQSMSEEDKKKAKWNLTQEEIKKIDTALKADERQSVITEDEKQKIAASNFNNDGATGQGSIAIGDKAIANNEGAIAIGQNSGAKHQRAISIGQGSDVTGEDGIAIGKGTTVSGQSSVAIGETNTVSGVQSYVLGSDNKIAGRDIFALGSNIEVKHDANIQNAVVLGKDSEAVSNAVSVGGSGKDKKRKIVYVDTPTKWHHAANKKYVDDQIKGIQGGSGASAKLQVAGNTGKAFEVLDGKNKPLTIKGKEITVKYSLDEAKNQSQKATKHQNITATAKPKAKTLELSLNEHLKGMKSIVGREIGAGKGKKIASSIEFNAKGVNGTKANTNVVISSNGGKFVFDRTGLTLNEKNIKGVKSGLGLVANTNDTGGKAGGDTAGTPPTDPNAEIIKKILAGTPDKAMATNAVNVKDLSKVANAVVDKGLVFKVGDATDKSMHRKLGEAVTFKGDSYITPSIDSTDGTITFKLSETAIAKTITDDVKSGGKPGENNGITPNDKTVDKLVTESAVKNFVNQKIQTITAATDKTAVKYDNDKQQSITLGGIGSDGTQKSPVAIHNLQSGLYKLNGVGDKADSFDELLMKIGDSKVTAKDQVEAVNKVTKVVEKLVKNVNKGSLHNAANVGDLKALAVAGLNFAGNDGKDIHKNLGEKLEIVGKGLDKAKAKSFKGTNGNIAVTRKDKSKLEISLNEELKGMKSISGREIGNGKGGKLSSTIEFNKQGANGTKPKTNVVIESNGGTFVFDRTGLTLNTKQIKGLASGLGLKDGSNDDIIQKVLAGTFDKDNTNGNKIANNAVNVQDLSDVAKAIANKVQTGVAQASTVVFTDDEGNKLTKVNDKYYKSSDIGTNGQPKSDATEVTPTRLLLVNHQGKTNEPVALGNVASGLGISENSEKEKTETLAQVNEIEKAIETENAELAKAKEEIAKQQDESKKDKERIEKQKAKIAELEKLPDHGGGTKLEDAKGALQTLLDGAKNHQKLIDEQQEIVTAYEQAIKEKQEALKPLQEKLNSDPVKQLVEGKPDDNKLKNVATIRDLKAIAAAGLSFAGNDGKAIHKKLSETFEIVGQGVKDKAKSFNGTNGNIAVKTSKDKSKLEISLNAELKGLKSAEFKDDKGNTTTIIGNEITLDKDDKTSATLTSSELTFKNGEDKPIIEIDGKEGKISVYADITPNSSPNVVVNKGYVDALQTQTDQKLNHLDNKIEIFNKDLRAGVAGAHAAAALPTVTMPGKSSLALSAGTYKGNNAVALGYSRLSDNGKIMLKLHGSRNSAGDFGGGVGVGWTW
ncbi:YadA-like family protein [Histophilus somni]|uniref:YadA-like family protein n=1 Tax=Histophilus somni TaxID=731 RepID=UPI00201EE555|nr:YadA-like family protein [Histophilus somni]